MKDTEKIVTALHLAPQFDINKFTNEIIVLRQQTINNAIMKELQNLMHEKGITELYAIDENKVMQLIKEHNALEIIRKYYYGNGVLFGEMTQEELNFLKEVLS